MLLITFSKAFKESYLMLTKTQGYIYIKRRIKTSISTLQHHSLSCGCGILWYNHTHCECFLHRCHLPAFPGAAVQTVFKCRFVFSLCILTETLSVVLSVWSIISFTFETFKISSFAPTFFLSKEKWKKTQTYHLKSILNHYIFKTSMFEYLRQRTSKLDRSLPTLLSLLNYVKISFTQLPWGFLWESRRHRTADRETLGTGWERGQEQDEDLNPSLGMMEGCV